MESSILNQASTLLGNAAPGLQRMAAATQGNVEAINTAAEEFEAAMLTAMLKPIFEGVETSEPFGGGQTSPVIMWVRAHRRASSKTESSAGLTRIMLGWCLITRWSASAREFSGSG